ncbi:MAG: hypothetical protein L0Z50_27295 [Verrucomicrobiales bacterium]|nr:hypothetical protein [Verrucomicrobiales bacterium]
MKKLILAATIVVILAFVWNRQHAHRKDITLQNERLREAAAHLTQQAEAAAAARQSAEQRLADLRAEDRLREVTASGTPANAAASLPTQLAEPDPSRQGGWPRDADFIYLSKQYLTNASYRLLDGDRLTDEAATLLGMSPAEREAVNDLFNTLLGQFRQIEVKHMELVDPPANLGVGLGKRPNSANQFDAAIMYRIPGLAPKIAEARQAFSEQLQQNLGPSRAQLIEQAADSYFRKNMDDLGSGERTVAFLWQRENDGTHSIWYGVAGDLHGPGTFNPVGLALKPNSPIAHLTPQITYYARLFGVQLPEP